MKEIEKKKRRKEGRERRDEESGEKGKMRRDETGKNIEIRKEHGILNQWNLHYTNCAKIPLNTSLRFTQPYEAELYHNWYRADSSTWTLPWITLPL